MGSSSAPRRRRPGPRWVGGHQHCWAVLPLAAVSPMAAGGQPTPTLTGAACKRPAERPGSPCACAPGHLAGRPHYAAAVPDSNWLFALPCLGGRCPQAVKVASEFVELTRKAINSWPNIKPWLNASDIETLVAKVGSAPAACNAGPPAAGMSGAPATLHGAYARRHGCRAAALLLQCATPTGRLPVDGALLPAIAFVGLFVANNARRLRPPLVSRAAPLVQVDEFSAWLKGKQEEQAKKEEHEDPAYKVDEVAGWLGRLKKVSLAGAAGWVGGRAGWSCSVRCARKAAGAQAGGTLSGAYMLPTCLLSAL